MFLGSGTVFGTILLNDPALFSQPRFSVEDLETASNTLLCEAGQSTGALTLFGRDNDNEVVATVASDHSADDCLVNGVAKETCRIFAYAISQTLLGASFAPQIANLSFELPSCVNAGNFHDIVGVEINSAPLPPSSLSVVQVTKLGSFETESQVLALKIDMFGLGDFPKPGQDFTVELIYDASFFLPADFPLRDVVNPFDHLVQISTFGKTATGAVCGPLYCSPYPSPVAPPPPPPAVSVCPEGASDSDKLGYTKERNEVTVIMLSDATIPTCVVGGKPESQCRQFCYGFLQSESNPSVKTNALESIKFEVAGDQSAVDAEMCALLAFFFFHCAHFDGRAPAASIMPSCLPLMPVGAFTHRLARAFLIWTLSKKRATTFNSRSTLRPTQLLLPASISARPCTLPKRTSIWMATPL